MDGARKQKKGKERNGDCTTDETHTKKIGDVIGWLKDI